jgi:hypothetical protein
MEIFTTAMLLKLAGAALGLWIGLGLPGLKVEDAPRRGAPRRYLHGTWLNRLFFGMPTPPRRFDVRRLVMPDRKRVDFRRAWEERMSDEEAVEESAD